MSTEKLSRTFLAEMLITDLTLFFGRFHPIVVHFPIAFLTLAGVVELLSRINRFKALSIIIPLLLFLGFISALTAVQLGWFIAQDRGYSPDILFWHRWMGIAVTILSLLLWLVSIRVVEISSLLRHSFFVVLFILVLFTGHHGGTLTHGKDYLIEYAPRSIRTFFADSANNNHLLLNSNPDSVQVFNDIINPIMVAKCTPCHDEQQKKGGLALTTWEGLQRGGDGGSVVTPLKALESELFIRVTLPPNHSKFMPIKAEPLSYAEIQLIEWWINEGALEEKKLTELKVSDNVKHYLIKDYQYNPTPKPYYEITIVKPAPPQDLASLKAQGFIIYPLAQNNNYLSVTISGDVTSLSYEQLEKLILIKDQISWIDFGNKKITDQHLTLISQMVNLTKLSLHNNPITDTGIESLTKLKYLELLNVYNTSITDDGLQALSKMENLRRLYLWQTDVTQTGIESILKDRPNLKIIQGAQH